MNQNGPLLGRVWFDTESKEIKDSQSKEDKDFPNIKHYYL